ncbi:Hypothetical predicted protein [Marmota monax]|uniref:Uncharacterized protein n=1 Tax=Marmota monax TaxID=9995 RepID=A0A5E4AQ16_MARMO|nr:hypothetical protein GHT09_013065 [Marmota monax]VTJ58749.1 Hypothetical predicted protein [Marmota monax]
MMQACKSVGFGYLQVAKRWLRGEAKMLDILVPPRVWSGGLGVLGMEVDGLPFHSVHGDDQKLVDTTKAHV